MNSQILHHMIIIVHILYLDFLLTLKNKIFFLPYVIKSVLADCKEKNEEITLSEDVLKYLLDLGVTSNDAQKILEEKEAELFDK